MVDKHKATELGGCFIASTCSGRKRHYRKSADNYVLKLSLRFS